MSEDKDMHLCVRGLDGRGQFPPHPGLMGNI